MNKREVGKVMKELLFDPQLRIVTEAFARNECVVIAFVQVEDVLIESSIFPSSLVDDADFKWAKKIIVFCPEGKKREFSNGKDVKKFVKSRDVALGYPERKKATFLVYDQTVNGYVYVWNGTIVGKVIPWHVVNNRKVRNKFSYGEGSRINEFNYYLVITDTTSRSVRVFGFSSLKRIDDFFKRNFDPKKGKWIRLPDSDDAYITSSVMVKKIGK